jgi:hypothetical protein
MVWPTRYLYHMMLNTVVGDDAVIKLILDEIDVLNQRPASPQQNSERLAG